MTAGLTIEAFWRMEAGEVLVYIRAYQRRMERWDELLAFNTKNTVAPPTKGSKKSPKLDVPKLKFFRQGTSREKTEAEREITEDDPDKVIVLEERRRQMEEMAALYGPSAIPTG